MSTVWYTILGLVFVLYLVLGGLDQGVAMLLPTMRGDGERRAALNAIGPMFLGNEVWVVGAAGLLIAAFPRLEGELFGAAYPAVVAAVLGLAGLVAGVQLRGRGKRRGGFDVLIAGSGLTLAGAWGLIFGVLLHGAPIGADGHVHGLAPFADPMVWLTALANVLLVLAHGSAFLRRRAVRLHLVAGAVAALTVAGWWVAAPGGIRNPLAGTVLGVACAAAVVAGGFLRRPGAAFAATAVACALPVVAAASALFPAVLASTLDPGATVTVDGAAAGEDALRLLTLGAAPLLPVLVAVQAAGWWLFRRRTSLYW
ncbi:cytochrome d ubiquinol oxidase subunit II [Dactylosporangium sp. CS-047395]|uniref:cytochrome d ubiquinol oxidase subunit II n=1 Tax=Dactylosporangium sp. CS-047395 TaxID=3239936 RepID=UPI003D8C61B2